MAGTTKNAFFLHDLNLDSLNQILGVIQREVDYLTGLLGEVTFRTTINIPTARTTGTFEAADGTVLLPSYTFTDKLNTGLYRSGTYTLDFSVNGTHFLGFDATAVTASLEANLALIASASTVRDLRFYELTGGGTNYVGFKAPNAIAANKVWKLPSADGTSAQVLSTNGSATLSWITPDGTTFASPTGNIDIGDSASEGVLTTGSRSDHQHTFTAPSSGYPLDVAATEANGTATTPARSDHVHALAIGTTKGDVLARSSTVWTRVAAGADDGTIFTTDSTAAPGVAWTTDIVATSTGRIGIGTTAPATQLHVSGTGFQQFDRYGSTATLLLRYADGTVAAPTQALSADIVASMSSRGYHSGGAFHAGSGATLRMVATENYTATAQGTAFTFSTTANTTTTLSERIRVDQNGNIGIGTTSPAASAKVDITSTAGALLLPRMTTAQRDALTAVNGMLIYNSTTAAMNKYQAGAWAAF